MRSINKETLKKHLDVLIETYPGLIPCKENIWESFCILSDCFKSGGKLLVCGNGGSAADADHIVSELGKGFISKRTLPEELKAAIKSSGSAQTLTDELSKKLQMGLPAINLSAHVALCTAIGNDIGYEYVFAQQVLAYGRKGDVLLGISTSGTSENVLNAGLIAKTLGLKTIGLTGLNGDKMSHIFDVAVRVPETETYKVQELHLPIYHCLCAMIEAEIFDK